MKKNGFTVIELMIATGIFGFIITSMTVALQQQQRQFNLTREAVDVDQTARSVLNFITTEVRNAASRQGKSFSFKFINGGSDPTAASTCDYTSDQATDFTGVQAGTVNSAPDCITIYSWDITRGQDGADLPSISVPVQVGSNTGAELKINLPFEWYDRSNLIGGDTPGDNILIGFRSRTNLCNPNPNINCIQNPESCAECAVILQGPIDAARQFTINNSNQIIEHNFPGDFTGISEFINGKLITTGGSGTVITETYGFLNSISSQSSEMSLVRAKTFRVDVDNRELEMSHNISQNFQPIAGGQQNSPNGLESLGIVDLQFVFNLQNQNGQTTKVGFCNVALGINCDAGAVPGDGNIVTYSDFSLTDVVGREQDIRSVEIYLVVKSKTKPRKSLGGFFHQTIPAIGDVAERKAPSKKTDTNPFAFKEPEHGFIYRLYSNTVYVRNMAREDFG